LTAALDLSTKVGEVALDNPVMTAAGTGGHGAELGAYFELAALGAIVVKSLAAEPWPGNPAPRVHPLPVGMLNSIGLQGPGVARWLEEDLPALERSGAKVVASIWGRRVEDYASAAALLAAAPPCVVAVEVNISCPNVEDRDRVFAHSASATREALAATEAVRRPRWAKLSPNVANLTEIAAAALEGGAQALTLVNTVLGLAIDLEARRPVLGTGGGGLSGPAVHAVAVRAVWDCHRAHPGVPLIGVGGVFSGVDAVELLLAGACAVQVGTATLADPRAPARVLVELARWCVEHDVTALEELIGAAHGS
jgi:dihydroorotate dehydrogenase (NAD+) catalytic subunit